MQTLPFLQQNLVDEVCRMKLGIGALVQHVVIRRDDRGDCQAAGKPRDNRTLAMSDDGYFAGFIDVGYCFVGRTELGPVRDIVDAAIGVMSQHDQLLVRIARHGGSAQRAKRRE